MTKWAQDVADAQAATGSVPAVVPSAIPLDDGGPAWADAAVICPWTMYLSYGDKRILENNYAIMTRFMDFHASTPAPASSAARRTIKAGRVLATGSRSTPTRPRDLIGTAFLAYDANLMAQIAAVLGKKRNDAAKYRKLFADVKTGLSASAI